MKPEHLFGVAVRAIGLIVIVVALLYLVSAFNTLLDPYQRPGALPAWHYLVDGLVGIITGMFLLRGASPIVKFAYPQNQNPTPDA